jgi:SAM-dependent methyltransferase
MCPHSYETVTPPSITKHDALVEASRLLNKAQLLIRATGGVFPGLPRDELERITTVLEIACGPGGWTREVAKVHPHMHITGVDFSRAMIAFARSTLLNQDVLNIEYLEVPSFVGPYPFNEGSFDLISAQSMSKFLTTDTWPEFLTICARLLRPGGLIRLREFEVGLTNAPAHEELSRLFIQAMRLAKRSFSPSDRHLGWLSELEPLLASAGFGERFCVPHVVNYSYSTPFYEEWKKDYLILSREVQPLVVEMGLATEKRIDELHRQQTYEMSLPTFHGVQIGLTIYGRSVQTASSADSPSTMVPAQRLAPS